MIHYVINIVIFDVNLMLVTIFLNVHFSVSLFNHIYFYNQYERLIIIIPERSPQYQNTSLDESGTNAKLHNNLTLPQAKA